MVFDDKKANMTSIYVIINYIEVQVFIGKQVVDLNFNFSSIISICASNFVRIFLTCFTLLR